MADKMRSMTHHGRGRGKKGYSTKHNDREFDIDQARNIDPELTLQNQYWHLYQDVSPEPEQEDPAAAGKTEIFRADMNWHIQSQLDEVYGTDFAKKDMARHFAQKRARERGEPAPPRADMTFDEAEAHFYQTHFADQLDQTNARYRKGGHPERCKSMDEWRQLRRNAPTESIYQIGDKHITGNHADAATLMCCYNEFADYEERWNEEHGNPFTTLTRALHVDEPECPPHIHVRRAWHYRSEDGTLRLGQEKALAQAGIELPDPGKKEGRFNNRKMVYDAMMREAWLDILERNGILVERQPLPDGKGKKSKSKEQYIREKYEQANREAEAQRKRADAEAARAAAAEKELADLRKQAAEAAKKAQAEELRHDKILARNEEALQILEQNEAEIRDQEQALNLIQDYEEYCNVADLTDADLALGERMIQRLPPPRGLFRPAEEKDWIRDIKSILQKLLSSIGEAIRRLQIFEIRQNLRDRRSEPAMRRAAALDAQIAGAEARTKDPSEQGRQGRQKGNETIGH